MPSQAGEHGGRVSAQDEVEEFAALLRQLKERTDRSYGSLARRLGMNTSTLHRYCAGDAVPQDFAPVERFAALCGASAEERMELHRRWLLAVAARQRPRGSAAAEAAEEEPQEPDDSTPNPEQEQEQERGQQQQQEEQPTPPHHPWYRRRHVTVAAAVASVLLATLGTVTALDRDRGDKADGRTPGADLRRTTAPGTPGATRGPSPSSPSPTPTGPSPTKKAKPSQPTSRESTPSTTSEPEPTGVPLTWSADSHVWSQGCGHDYVIGRPPTQVPPPPPAQDARTWAGAEGAVHGRETMVRISVQGRSSTAVVLEALRVRVVGRAAPVEGSAYAMDQGCGGAVTPRYFDVDLDKDRPIARPVAGNDSGTVIPAMRLPYRVSAEDPEVLLVTARTEGCDCRWWLELDWSSQGHKGTVRIDDEGRPLRTTSIKGLPRYGYDTSARAWTPYS